MQTFLVDQRITKARSRDNKQPVSQNIELKQVVSVYPHTFDWKIRASTGVNVLLWPDLDSVI